MYSLCYCTPFSLNGGGGGGGGGGGERGGHFPQQSGDIMCT